MDTFCYNLNDSCRTASTIRAWIDFCPIKSFKLRAQRWSRVCVSVEAQWCFKPHKHSVYETITTAAHIGQDQSSKTSDTLCPHLHQDGLCGWWFPLLHTSPPMLSSTLSSLVLTVVFTCLCCFLHSFHRSCLHRCSFLRRCPAVGKMAKLSCCQTGPDDEDVQLELSDSTRRSSV